MNVQNTGMPIKLILVSAFLIVGVISIVWMIGSILKIGDERRKAIILKASHWTFLEIVGILFVNLFYYIFITKKQVRGINSIVFLSVIGILYLINLLIFKKKHGD